MVQRHQDARIVETERRAEPLRRTAPLSITTSRRPWREISGAWLEHWRGESPLLAIGKGVVCVHLLYCLLWGDAIQPSHRLRQTSCLADSLAGTGRKGQQRPEPATSRRAPLGSSAVQSSLQPHLYYVTCHKISHPYHFLSSWIGMGFSHYLRPRLICLPVVAVSRHLCAQSRHAGNPFVSNAFRILAPNVMTYHVISPFHRF